MAHYEGYKEIRRDDHRVEGADSWLYCYVPVVGIIRVVHKDLQIHYAV